MSEISRYFQVLGFTFAQAFTSALASMLFGYLGAMGLTAASASRKSRAALIALALLPNTLPIIFVIFSFMKYLPLARGFVGIIIIHTMLNSGLAAIAIYQLLQNKIGSLADLAYIENCSRTRFFFKVILPYLKNDLFRIFFFVFAICFTSFAVPLMIGGASGTTIEVLIYEKIRVSADWTQAFIMTLVEVIFILFVSLFVRRDVAKASQISSRNPLLSLDFGIIVIVFPAAFVCFCLVQSSLEAKASLDFSTLALGSFFVALGSGLLSLILFFITARFRPAPRFRRLLLGLATPSAVIVGFALLILVHATGWASFFKLIIGLTFMHFPILYRLSWDAQIFSISQQIETAKTIGASQSRIFSKIIAPQVLRSAYHLSGLAALWAFSDFTLASVVAEKDLTLAQLFSHLIETYRWEAAESLILPMMAGSILCYILFSGVGYVASRRTLR